MNTVKSFLVVVAFLVLSASIALAAGTPAGTVISSRAKATYTTLSGGTLDSTFSNTVSITVAQVAAVNVTPPTGAVTTSTDSVNVDYALSIVNSGNGKDKFNLTKASSKGWTVSFYKDANGNGILDAAELLAGTITATDSVKADSSFKIITRIFVPRNPALNNQSDVTTVTATSLFDNTKTANSALTTTVHTANFSNIGTGFSIDNASPSAGQNVTYTFSITNNGAVAATGVTFTDFISSPPFTFVSATSGGILGGSTVTWNVGTVNPLQTVTVTVTLLVQGGTANGTILNNAMNVTYTVGGNTFIETSNTPPAAVGVTRGVSISPLSLSAAKEPDDTVKYYLTLKNTGNTKDILEMSYSSSLSYTWTFYKDANNNGIFEGPGTDTPLSNTPGSPAGVDVDSVALGDSVHIFALLVVPVAGADQTQDVTTITVKSAGDASKFQSSTATTTIDMAVIAVSKSVVPLGTQPPGQQMTYTITYHNTGHGSAYNFKVIDSAPDSTTYVPGTVLLNGVGKTDASDADEVTVNGKNITVNIGTLAPGATGTVAFKITIN